MTREQNRNAKMPAPVVRRLPRYMAHVRELCSDGVEWVSSLELAKALRLTSSTVRQDLSHIDLTGISKRGYETKKLLSALRKELDSDNMHSVVIVGAGLMGRALATHGELHAQGFEVAGLYDHDPQVIGQEVGGQEVKPMSDLKKDVREGKAQIGVVAVPAASAQGVANQLVDAGVGGLLNLAYAHIHAPDNVEIIDARLVARLQELTYFLR